jgi:hypothetical protein
MTNIEFDYSRIPSVEAGVPSRWKPPKRAYFGPKDANGEMIDEPVYVHVEFPRAMYLLEGNRMIVDLANDQEGKDALVAEGFRLTPGDWGIFTAPSVEQINEEKEIERQAKRDVDTGALTGRVRRVDPPEPVEVPAALLRKKKTKNRVSRKGR